MPARQQVQLVPGRVYRTAELEVWGGNPSRLAARLQKEGSVQRLGHGLLYAPVNSRFGMVPPSDEALLDAVLGKNQWLITGPPKWNALKLGSTQVFANPLIYNTSRTGKQTVGGRTFQFRRVKFPSRPPAEWFVVDLLKNAASVGLSHDSVEISLRAALKHERFLPSKLVNMAKGFGRRVERDLVRRAIGGLS